MEATAGGKPVSSGTSAASIEGFRPSMLPDAQLEMLRDNEGKLPVMAINQARRAGRPKNAKNKRSKKIADYFVQRYGDPLDVLGNLMNTPLKLLVDLLMEADGSAAREAKLMEMVEEATDHIKTLRGKLGGEAGKEMAETLADAIDKLAAAAQRISGKPGKLALDALALQIKTTLEAAQYVHGKQPISVDITGKADLVVFAPELLARHGIDAGELQRAVEARGVEAFDAENLRILPPDEAEDAEFTPADGEDEV